MSVTLTRVVKLKVAAGAAKPGPAIGQALGPLGLNMAEFCKQFNEQTKTHEKDVIVSVALKGECVAIGSCLLYQHKNLYQA